MLRRCSPLLVLIAVFFVACGSQRIDPNNCEAVGDQQPICGFSNPEDMAVLPDQRHMLISEYGLYFEGRPGHLALFDTQSQKIQRFPALNTVHQPLWADVDCPGPPGEALSPHGIHLSQRADGAWQLLVVNHGGQERIEFIELKTSDAGYELLWRGCLVPPHNTYINSVAATPEGGVVFSHMYRKDSFMIGTTALALLPSLFGQPTGHVYEWKGQYDDFSIVPSSEAGFPNGVEVSPDGRYLYMAASTSNKVIKIDRQRGERVAELDIAHPDNLRWDGQGQLLVAGMPVSALTAIACQEDSRAYVNCGGAYEVHRIDPDRWKAERIVAHAGGPPFGAATVAQALGDDLYVGSFAGDRVLKVPYK